MIWLQRDLDKIMAGVDIQGRPLLKEGKEKILDLYEARKNLYAFFSDAIVDNNGTIENTVKKILEVLPS